MYGLSGPVPPDSALAKRSAAHGFDLSSLDPTCPACKDFAQFATGGWKKNNPIPADRSNWARFLALLQQNQATVRGILEDAERAGAAPGSNTQKIGDFYRACTNMDARNAAGITPLKPQLDRIAAVDRGRSAGAARATCTIEGVDAFFAAGGVTTDAKELRRDDHRDRPRRDLGLPDRDFYLKTDAKSQVIRDAYLDYVAKDLTLAGTERGRRRARKTIRMHGARDRDREDVARERRARGPGAELPQDRSGRRSAKRRPRFAWDALLRRALAARRRPHPINLSNADYATRHRRPDGDDAGSTTCARTCATTSISTRIDGDLSQPFVDDGVRVQLRADRREAAAARSKQRCTIATDNYLGEALGAVYVAKKRSRREAKAPRELDDREPALRSCVTTSQRFRG